MIRKLILSKQSYLQLIIVLFGSLFGLLLMMSSMQVYTDVKSIVDNKKELISSQFLVVNKPVNMLDVLSGSAETFTETEINEFRKLKSVEKVGTFKANKFRAQTGFIFEGKTMMTDMFFEAVPQDFLDVKSDDWQWSEGEPVPIILPTDYLNLYNFGFAPSQGLPQISKGAAKLAGLRVIVSGNGSSMELQGFIAGFTDRINSILVPESFIEYSNRKYGNVEEKGASRLVVLSSDPSDEELSDFIEKAGYETNLELLKNGKLNALLKMILGILLLIGSVIILLSILGFIQYAQLLMVSSKYEIKTLLYLGYKVRHVFSQYFWFYLILLMMVTSLGYGALLYVKHHVNAYMIEKGFEPTSGIASTVITSGLLLVTGFLVLNALNIYRTIRHYAKPE